MALEEVVEGTPLDIPFPAKHRYHLDTHPTFKSGHFSATLLAVFHECQQSGVQ